MTRVESIISQVKELTDAERHELITWMGDHYEYLELPPGLMEELERRIQDFESGVAVTFDADEVLASLRAELRGHRSA